MTLAFGAVTAVLFLAIGISLYVSVAAALLDEIDTGLRFRAATLQAEAAALGETPAVSNPQLAEPGEALAQVVAADGTVLRASPRDRTAAVLPAQVIGRLTGPAVFERRVPGIAGTARLLAAPAGSGPGGSTVVVGASMQDRADTLRLLAGVLGIAGPAALAVACLAGWRVAGSALDPVERMRGEAAAVAVSGLDRRLSVPTGDDEITRLGRTLNEMLDRLETSIRTERQFLDVASHELRTPLATLRAELDLGLARPRNLAETRATLRSASEETDRLIGLAEDLLVLSRAHGGGLPLQRTTTSLRELVAGTVRRWEPRAAMAGLQIRAATAVDAPVLADPTRIRQALDNLLDNAVRHSPPNGVLTVVTSTADGRARVEVADDGPGIPDGGTGAEDLPTGLGLRIARAVAQAHGGTLELDNRTEGGARAVLSLPVEA